MSGRGRPVTRRAVLGAALWLAGAAPSRAAQLGAPAEGSAAGGSLSAEEVEDLVALGETLVEGGPLPAHERRLLLEHIDYRVVRHRYAARYRSALRELERLAGARFSVLTQAARNDLVARDAPHAQDAAGAGVPSRAPSPATRERARVMRDLIAGYYASPAGWAVVGQSAFPGRCGDLTRYTRPDA